MTCPIPSKPVDRHIDYAKVVAQDAYETAEAKGVPTCFTGSANDMRCRVSSVYNRYSPGCSAMLYADLFCGDCQSRHRLYSEKVCEGMVNKEKELGEVVAFLTFSLGILLGTALFRR